MASRWRTRPTAVLRLSRSWPWLWGGPMFHGVPSQIVPARAPALPAGRVRWALGHVARSHPSRRARRDHAGEYAGAPRGVLCGDGSGVSDGNVAAFLEVDEVGVGGDVRTVGCNLCAFLEETRKVLGVGNPEEVGVECVNVLWGSLE